MPPTVAIEPPRVFIDSGGFIALHVSSDAHHEAAVLCRDRSLRYSRLYTSSVVISETIAHIQRDNLLDQHNLQDLLDDFLKPGGWGASLLVIDDDISMKSLQMVKDRQDRRFSFVDAANIVLMEKHHIDFIFSFDGFYEGFPIQRGYNTRFIQRIGDNVVPAHTGR